MITTLIVAGRAVSVPFASVVARLQARLDLLLVPAETAEPGQKSEGFPTWVIVLIAAVVLLLCVLPICIITILTLLGPAIGNVFSNIITDL